MKILCVLSAACLCSAVAHAQPAPATVSPLRPSAGAELRITQACAPSNAPQLRVGDLTLRAMGSGSDWRVTLPPALKPDVYSVRWECGVTDPAKELPQLAIIEVLPIVPRVVSVSNSMRDRRLAESASKDDRAARDRLKDVLEIKVANLAAWRLLDGNTAAELHLYLAGSELKNVVPKLSSSDPNDPVSSLTTVLEVDDGNPENRRQWVQALRVAMERDDRTIPITVGPTGAPFPSDATIKLDVFPSYTAGVALALAGVVVVLIVLGKRSNLLRDSNGSATPPYSLAKHQMAVWFIVIVGSYLYVWLITGTFSSISMTALTLIGISGATGLVAVTMDHSKRSQATSDRQGLEAERDALEAAVNGAGGLKSQLAASGGSPEAAAQLLATIAAKETRLNELKAKLTTAPLPAASPSRQWVLDLLSDDNGVSFHRLQMIVWTLVLAIVFVRAVVWDVLMPDFNTTLLGLLGISSGTYLGFKFPEKL